MLERMILVILVLSESLAPTSDFLHNYRIEPAVKRAVKIVVALVSKGFFQDLYTCWTEPAVKRIVNLGVALVSKRVF